MYNKSLFIDDDGIGMLYIMRAAEDVGVDKNV